MFERCDVSPVTRLRPAPLRLTRFIADVHLGSLARYLRLLGFDTVWERDLADELERVMAPIGLDIGARTPEETAISICSEIIAMHSGRSAPSLRDGNGPIHG